MLFSYTPMYRRSRRHIQVYFILSDLSKSKKEDAHGMTVTASAQRYDAYMHEVGIWDDDTMLSSFLSKSGGNKKDATEKQTKPQRLFYHG